MMVDLKQLILLIAEKKDVDADYSLDQGCVLPNADQATMIKIINYLYNYVGQHTKTTFPVALELKATQYVLTIVVYSESEVANLSINPQVVEAIISQNGQVKIIIDNPKLFRIVISFAK
jgi:hypothetical protein